MWDANPSDDRGAASQRSTWPDSRPPFRRSKVEATQEHDLDRRNTMGGAAGARSLRQHFLNR